MKLRKCERSGTVSIAGLNAELVTKSEAICNGLADRRTLNPTLILGIYLSLQCTLLSLHHPYESYQSLVPLALK